MILAAISDGDLNGHKADMFDAIRDFFKALTTLTVAATEALQQETKAGKK